MDEDFNSPDVTPDIIDGWKALAAGRGVSKHTAEAMLADLAAFTRFYEAVSPDTPTEVLRDLNGRRAVFARILLLLDVPPAVADALRQASREFQQPREG